MDNYDSVILAENRKAMKHARESRPVRNRDFYLKDQFAKNDEQKEHLGSLRNEVKSALREVTTIDQNIKGQEKSKSLQALKTGRHALILKRELELILKTKKKPGQKFSIPSYMSVHFNKDVRRINEYIAARKASRVIKKSGKKNVYSLTHLIILGQALGSKDIEKKAICRKALRTNKLPDKTTVSEIKSTQLNSKININLRDKGNNMIYSLSDIEQSVKNLESKMRSFEDSVKTFNKIKIHEKEELFLKSAQIVDSAEKILERINLIRKAVKSHIKLTGSGQNQV